MAATEPTAAEIRQAQRGSVEAFENIVKYYSTFVYNFAYRFVFDRSEAHDLAQEVFLRLYRNLREFDSSRPFRPWLYRLTTNVCINAARALKRKPHPEDPDVLAQRRSDTHTADPAAMAAARDSAAMIQQAVAQLPEDYRSVVVLRYLKDMSCEEIASTLDVPVGTVKTWLFRARELLKQEMKADGQSHTPE